MSLAFVAPRYGEHVIGGAEAVARHFAERLAHDHEHVEVFTTCADDYVTWKNALPAGPAQTNGVTVRRYPIDPGWPRKRHNALREAILRNEPLTHAEQFEWVDSAPHSPLLYQALTREAQRFEFVFVIPYPFGISYYAAEAVRDKTIVWPCLHDEAYAYLAPTQLMLRSARGLCFNAEAERQLAIHKLKLQHPATCVVGLGLDPVPADTATAAKRFRHSSGIHDPFILYAGRISPAKNVPLLIDYFCRYKEHRDTPLKLVLMGGDNGETLSHPDILSIGKRSDKDKFDAYAAATALCQPSVNESFSIVLMEAWQMGTPTLVHRDCAVTHAHVLASNGGLYFDCYDVFEGAIDVLLGQPVLRQTLGSNGQRYVREQYSWPAVMQRFRAGLEIWRAAPWPNVVVDGP